MQVLAVVTIIYSTLIGVGVVLVSVSVKDPEPLAATLEIPVTAALLQANVAVGVALVGV